MAHQRIMTSLPNGTSNSNTQTPLIIPLTRQRARVHLTDDYSSTDWETSGSESAAPVKTKARIRTRLLIRARAIFRPSTRLRNVANRPPTPWAQQQLSPIAQTGVRNTRRGCSGNAAEQSVSTSATLTPEASPAYEEGAVGPSNIRSQPQVDNYRLQSAQESSANRDRLPWEAHRAPQSLQPLIPDWPSMLQQDTLGNSGHSSLQHSPVEHYTGAATHSRHEDLGASGTPPPSYDNIGFTGPSSGQVHAGLAALYRPFALPPMQSLQPSEVPYDRFGLFAVLPSVIDGEWVNGIMSADSGLLVYRNVSRSFSGGPEAIIHVRDTATRLTASAFFGFRGAGGLVIHRNGQPVERVLIDDSTTLEVEVNDAELLPQSLEGMEDARG